MPKFSWLRNALLGLSIFLFSITAVLNRSDESVKYSMIFFPFIAISMRYFTIKEDREDDEESPGEIGADLFIVVCFIWSIFAAFGYIKS